MKWNLCLVCHVIKVNANGRIGAEVIYALFILQLERIFWKKFNECVDNNLSIILSNRFSVDKALKCCINNLLLSIQSEVGNYYGA